jgi:hypothetical protein
MRSAGCPIRLATVNILLVRKVLLRSASVSPEQAVLRERREIVAHLRALAKRRRLDAREFASKKLGNAYGAAATCVREADVYTAAAQQVEMRGQRPSASFSGKGRKQSHVT